METGANGDELIAEFIESVQIRLRANTPFSDANRKRGGCKVGRFHWQSHLKTISSKVTEASGRIFDVIFRVNCSALFEDLPASLLSTQCNCIRAFTFHSYGFCEHAFAAANELLRQLGDHESELWADLVAPFERDLFSRSLGIFDHWLEEGVPADTGVKPRWVWCISMRVLPGNIRSPVLEVLEQRVTKNGSWSAGKRIQIQRLVHGSSKGSCDQDRRVVTAIRESSWNTYGFESSFLVFESLIGHPLVVFSERPNQFVSVLSGALGLTLEREKAGWRLDFTINGQTLHDAEWVFHVPSQHPTETGFLVITPENIFAVRCNDATRKFVQSVRLLRQVVPEDRVGELLARLAKSQERIPITYPRDLFSTTARASSQILLRLTPERPQGLRVELRCRPEERGQSFEPAQGAPEFTGEQDGQPVLFQRDFESEANRAREVVELLELEQHASLADWVWRTRTDDEALDLIAKLSDMSASDSWKDVLVEWPDGNAMSMTRTIMPQSLRVQIVERKDWFGLNGKIEIDGDTIQLADLLRGLRSGGRYVAVGQNRWARIEASLRRRLEALSDAAHLHKDSVDLDMTAVPVMEELCADDVSLKTCAAWNETVERLKAAQELNPEPPITLQADLRDYQRDGYRWLRRLAEWGVGGCLADDMGLGKTVQTLAVLVDRFDEGPSLVIAPTSVCFNWVRETARFAPTLRPIMYRETDRSDIIDILRGGDLLIVSYGLMLRDAARLSKVAWGTLVLDEAQKVKNAVTKTAQAVRQLNSKWKLALTGTPLENHLGELWSIFRAVCPGLLGSWERFREKFADPIERGHDGTRRRDLARLMRPFILRRTKSEVLTELPDRTEVVRTAELSESERAQYDQVRLQALTDLADVGEETQNDKRFQVLACLTRLRQLACHPRLVDGDWRGSSAKLDLFLEIVDELREGNHRALVFSQFTQHLALIREALDGLKITYQYLDGQTPPKERERRVDAFQHGEGELFLISLKAGGTGLNLTAADYVIHMDPWWNPAVEDQATDRAHRIGQTRPVTVYRLVAKDTIEEQILSLHGDKRQLVSGVLEGTDQAGKLSTMELVDLIRGDGSPPPPADPAKPAPGNGARPSGRTRIRINPPAKESDQVG